MPFSTQAAYTQHIDRNIGCYSYVVMRAHVLSRHGAPVVPCHPSVHEDGYVMWTSNKRASLLRRHMVTEVTGEGELPAVAAVNSGTSFDMLEALPGVSLSFPEDNEMGSMYSGDFDQHVASLSSNDDNDEEGPSFSSKFMYTTDQKWTVRLLKILDHANAPDYTFGEVLQWARGATAERYSYHPIGGLSRSKNVDANKRLIKDPARKQLFVPIIQWIDRTSVTGNERFSLKPYMFTPAIFPLKIPQKYQGMGVSWVSPQEESLFCPKSGTSSG